MESLRVSCIHAHTLTTLLEVMGRLLLFLHFHIISLFIFIVDRISLRSPLSIVQQTTKQSINNT